jgi:endonuclease/exonuclease/phosphatase family metal-dependent hydrolase
VAAAGARRYWLIWFAVLPTALWALVRVFGLDSGFPLATLMAFTPYAAIAALLVAGVATALENWAAAALAWVAVLALAAAVLPRAIGDGTVSAKGHETLNVLAANVLRGHADPVALVELVERLHPDLLSVEELTPEFVRKLEAHGILRLLPNTELETEGHAKGAGIYSRLPLRPLPGPDSAAVPDGRHMPRAVLTLPDGRRVRVVSVHTDIPGSDSAGRWEHALAGMPSAGTGVPWVLLGDFNATLDQSPLRELIDRGYRDAGDVAGKGLEPTFPRAYHRLIPPVTIDHVLADERLGIVEYSVEELPKSDHRAIHAVLALPGRG